MAWSNCSRAWWRPASIAPTCRRRRASGRSRTLFVKQSCEFKADGQVTRIEARHYYKPGQYLVDPNDNRITQNEFESSARLEVFRPPAATIAAARAIPRITDGC